MEKTPAKNVKKVEIIVFMPKHDIEIPNPIPIKPALLKENSRENIEKQYVIDSMDEKGVCSVQWLLPHHCILNP